VTSETVPGEILRDEILPPKGYVSLTMDKGQTLRIVDLDGQQVADFICYNRHNTGEKLSVGVSFMLPGKLNITTGDGLYSDDANRMMTITDDTCGRHDLLGGWCSTGLNRVRYGVVDNLNCRSNLTAAMAPFGVPMREIPYSFNIFMNVVISPDEHISVQAPISKPGDYIDLRADMDLIVAISNCPQERNICNGFKATRLRIIAYAPDA
jgi:uncharacterized protein YcgI (DUF1989 family)